MGAGKAIPLAGDKRTEAAPGGLSTIGRDVGYAYGNYARERQRRGAQAPRQSGFPGGNIPSRRPGE
tara:strand:- start:1496 stop:1693 length:198 start_codon:yes stop_codon:yes gene_type:complete